jgi:hypothetical protein
MPVWQKQTRCIESDLCKKSAVRATVTNKTAKRFVKKGGIMLCHAGKKKQKLMNYKGKGIPGKGPLESHCETVGKHNRDE